MKYLKIALVFLMAMFIIAFASDTGTKEKKTEPQDFQSGLYQVITVYYEIGQALVDDDDIKLAAENAEVFKTRLTAFETGNLPESLKSTWTQQQQDLQRQADNLLAEKNLAGQRQAFLQISQTLIEAVKTFGTAGQAAYLYHCPMALKSGGHWLSPVKDVANPYLGQEMLSCGTLVEEFKAE